MDGIIKGYKIKIPKVTGEIRINVAAVEKDAEMLSYTITNNLANCVTNNNATSVNIGSSYAATITMNSGYELMNISITMGGTNITSDVYKYQDGNAVINIPSVTGDVVITAQATATSTGPTQPTTYTITNSLANCTSSNTANSVNQGATYSATVTPNSGYELMNVAITMGGTNVTSTVYTYQNGNAVINISSVTGNVVITVQAVASSSGGDPGSGGDNPGSGSDPADGNVLSYMTYGKGIDQTTTAMTDNPECWATVEPVSVTNGTTYTISCDATYLWVLAIDNNGDAILPFLTAGTNEKPQSFVFTATTSKIKYGCYDPSHALTYCTLTEGGTVVNPTPTPTPDPTPTPTPDPGTGSDLTGTYLFFGDSICAGGGSNGYGYPEAVKAKQPSMTAVNYAVSGTCIAKNDSYDVNYPSILSRIQGSTPYADYVVLEGGFNDSWGYRNPIGSFKGGSAPTDASDISSYASSLNEYQFADALEKCICEIKLKYWEKKIFYVIPHNVDAAVYANEYYTVAIQVCNKWGVILIDLRNCGMPASKDETYNVDGTHPSAAGYDTYYAQPIINVLKANK